MSARADLEHAGLLTGLLKSVSRSFYLTMQVLPGEVRNQISLAYLLARTSDTIADTSIVPVENRLETLRLYSEAILGGNLPDGLFAPFLAGQGDHAEKVLLQRAREGIALLHAAGAPDKKDTQKVLGIIISGQELDLKRFDLRVGDTVKALPDAAALEEYTYRVAGCVGEFWTTICYRNLYHSVPSQAMIARGIEYGKGLQLINILRDMPGDFGQGRCYLPEDELRQINVNPAAILTAGEEKVRPVFNKWLDKAEKYVESGWEYTLDLPRRSIRLKLASAWPVLIGAKTIEMLRKQPILDPQRRVKISRPEVRKILLGSAFRLPFPGLWAAQFRNALPNRSKCC
ncbi:MAG: Farnesyl-diphosphate farnesyltransferase [Verrucomicrobiales bacterium]|nr:Farnesyl-diphosphate farnesyltransferase [Verrucomicrobiales bacterium]